MTSPTTETTATQNSVSQITADGTKKTKVLLEMRPAFEGFAGIPQETRLLFSIIAKMRGYEVEGLLQGGQAHLNLSRGTPKKETRYFQRKTTSARRYGIYSKVITSLREKPYLSALEGVNNFLERRLEWFVLRLGTIFKFPIKSTVFRGEGFEDFLWRTLFDKTLPSAEFSSVVSKNFQIISASWQGMHHAGLSSIAVSKHAVYPKLNLGETEIFIGQTPYPGQVGRKTRMIIRYHDAIPIFYPHTINDVSEHQATHQYALEGNAKSGAWFACVSEATRQDLLKLHPEVEKRAVTIHNIISPHYFREETPFERVRGIIRSRIYGADPESKGLGVTPEFLNLREQESFYRKHLFGKEFKYLLVVSTIEPRKNHSRAIAAWEILKEELDPDLKLVIVGTLGWGFQKMVKQLRTWIDRGELFMLNSVPSPDLRVLYRHAAATVCPSVQEGFDFSGVEAMCSGGITAASDIPVHREIYEDAAEYFDPYSTRSAVDCLKRMIYSPDSAAVRTRLEKRGGEISQRYTPKVIMPKWEAFLEKVRTSA
jgi:glycosyltransferase involved in cell wall biosynthesis